MTDKLFESFSALDDDLIERSFEKRTGRRYIFPIAALAACLAVVLLARVPKLGMKDAAGGAAENFFSMSDSDQNAAPGAATEPEAENPAAPAEAENVPGPGASADGFAGDAPAGYPSDALMPGTECTGGAVTGGSGVSPDIPEDDGVPADPAAGDYTGALGSSAESGSPELMTPPELTFNRAGPLPEVTAPFAPERTAVPLTAEQLAQVWSRDCPAALLEPGEQDMWDHGVSLSGEAVYTGGAFEKLVLTFREKDNPVTAVADVTVSDSLTPACASLPEDAEPVLSWQGSLNCLAYRCDGPEDTLFGAVFLIGPVRWEVRAQAAPGQEQDARRIVERFCTSYQSNALNGVYPDLEGITD